MVINRGRVLNKNSNFFSTMNRIIFMVLGSVLVSIGLEIFLIPNNIIDGGIVIKP